MSFKSSLHRRYPNATVFAFSRNADHPIDYHFEASIASAAEFATKEKSLDLVIVTVGMLHHEELMPEKSLRDLSAENFNQLFSVNTIIPSLIAKFFLPKLTRKNTAIFAALSARVGSISDNRRGGWYAYRASKAALNMIIKNAAIEINQRNKHAIVVGLHPGTVDSGLSKPFQANVPKEKLFTPEYSSEKLLDVLNHLTVEASGQCFAWDGQEIFP